MNSISNQRGHADIRRLLGSQLHWQCDGLIMISKMCRDRAKFHVLDDERDRLLAPTQFPVDYRVTQKIEF